MTIVDPVSGTEGEAELRDAHVHHLRNVLGVIRALVRRAADEAIGRDPVRGEDLELARLDGRIGAFMRAHSVAAHDLSAGVDLDIIIAEELLVFGLDRDDAIVVSGEPVRLVAGAGALLAMLVHELARAAINGDPPITVAIAWTRTADGLTFSWQSSERPTRRDVDTLDWLRKMAEYDFDGSLAEDNDAVVMSLSPRAISAPRADR